MWTLNNKKINNVVLKQHETVVFVKEGKEYNLNVYVGTIPLPKDYPNTEMVKILKKNKIPLQIAQVMFLIDPMKKLPVELSSFMVWPNSPLFEKTKEEEACCKGLGKYLLKSVLLSLLKDGLITKTQKIELKANASVLESACDLKDKEVKHILQQYPYEIEFFKKAENKHPLKKDLHILACQIKQNLHLINYYNSLGFRRNPASFQNKHGLDVSMYSTIGRVLESIV